MNFSMNGIIEGESFEDYAKTREYLIDDHVIIKTLGIMCTLELGGDSVDSRYVVDIDDLLVDYIRASVAEHDAYMNHKDTSPYRLMKVKLRLHLEARIYAFEHQCI